MHLNMLTVKEEGEKGGDNCYPDIKRWSCN